MLLRSHAIGRLRPRAPQDAPVPEPASNPELEDSDELDDSEESEDGDEYEAGSFVTDDSSGANVDAHRVVDEEVALLRAARADIRECLPDLFWSSTRPVVIDDLDRDARRVRITRARDRLAAAARHVGRAEWRREFVARLRAERHVALANMRGSARGICAACGNPRTLSRVMSFGRVGSSEMGREYLGRVCALRAMLTHTLMHAPAACAERLEAAPIADVARVETGLVDAVARLLDAADIAAALEEESADTDELGARVRALRARIGL